MANRVLAREADEVLDDGDEFFARVRERFSCQTPIEQLLLTVFEHRAIEIELRLEVGVQRGLLEIDAVGEVAQRYAGESIASGQRPRFSNDPGVFVGSTKGASVGRCRWLFLAGRCLSISHRLSMADSAPRRARSQDGSRSSRAIIAYDTSGNELGRFGAEQEAAGAINGQAPPVADLSKADFAQLVELTNNEMRTCLSSHGGVFNDGDVATFGSDIDQVAVWNQCVTTVTDIVRNAVAEIVPRFCDPATERPLNTDPAFATSD